MLKKIPPWVALEDQANRENALLKEPEIFRYMIGKGFPYAQQYINARAAFDRLPYATTDGYRYFSVGNDLNYSMVSAPIIGIGPLPDKRSGRLLAVARQQFDVMKSLVDAHAAEEWPGRYFLSLGDWIIYTSNRKMVKDAVAHGISQVSHAVPYLLAAHQTDLAKPIVIEQLLQKYQQDDLVLEIMEAARRAQADMQALLQRALGELHADKDAWL